MKKLKRYTTNKHEGKERRKNEKRSGTTKEKGRKEEEEEKKKKKELKLWLLGHKPHNLQPDTNQYWKKSRTEALTLNLKRVN